ncbi:MAG: aldo/keto reductase [Burkholderiaceae bacterium]
MKAADLRTVAEGRLRLSALGLGAAALAGMYEAVDAQEAADALAAAWDAGLRYLDTAPYYGYTLGEHRVGAFLRERPRQDFVIGTKVGRLMQPDASVRAGSDGWARPLPFRPVFDYGRDAILRSAEDSLQRLGLDRVDMLLVHDIGRVTHGDRHAAHWQALTRGGGFRALEELRRDGRVAAIGLGVNEWRVMQDAMQECDLDCSLLAGRYTLLEQRSLPFLDECARRRHAIVIGGAFNSGLLAGQAKFDYADAPPELLRRAAALRATCAEFDVPLEAAALQFPLGHPAVASVLSGMRSPAQVRQNVAWFERPIPAGLWDALRERGLLEGAAPCPRDRGTAP